MRYSNTEAGQMLAQRFGFTFSEDPRLQAIEDHLYGRAIKLMQLTNRVRASIRNLTAELGYLGVSIEDPERVHPYIPLGGFSTSYARDAELLDDIVYEVIDLTGAINETHAALVKADESARQVIDTAADHRTRHTVHNPVTGAPLGTVALDPIDVLVQHVHAVTIAATEAMTDDKLTLGQMQTVRAAGRGMAAWANTKIRERTEPKAVKDEPTEASDA